MSTQWNFTIDDTSPIFHYSPYAEGIGAVNGWATWYTGSGYFGNHTFGDSSLGDSFHLSSLNGASVSLSFFGHSITLLGTSNITYSVTVDGTLQSIGTSPPNTLFAVAGLSETIHNVTLSVAAPTDTSGGTFVMFDKAIVSSNAPSADGSEPTKLTYDNSNSSVQYSGSWKVSTAQNIPSFSNPEPFHETSSHDAAASLQFSGRAVAINGVANWGGWSYSVSLDGQTQIFNASSFWIIPNALLFYQDGLDPNATHTLTLTNVAGDGMDMWLNSIDVYQVNQALSSTNTTNSTATTSTSAPGSSQTNAELTAVHKLSGGAIAGIVIVVIAAIALAIGAFFYLRRRRNAVPASPSLSFQQKQLPLSASNVAPYAIEALDHHPGSMESNPTASAVSLGQPAGAGYLGAYTEKGRVRLDYPTPPMTQVSDSIEPSRTAPSSSGDSPSVTGNTTYRESEQRSPAVSSPTDGSMTGQDAAIDRIVDYVAERMAQRLGIDTPPPSYPQ